MNKIQSLRAKLRNEFEQAAQEAIKRGTGDKMLDAITVLASVGNLCDALKREKQLVDMCKMSNIDLNGILDDEFYYVCNKYIDDSSMDRMLETISSTNMSLKKSTVKKTWEITGRELLKDLDPQGFKGIKSATVTEKEQEWGISRSICLTMKVGGKKYIPLSKDSELKKGDEVDLDSIEIITLERDGDEPIYRADGEKLTLYNVMSRLFKNQK